jgi:hypothetical protein
LQPTTPSGVLIWMHAERSPFVGIVLAVVFVVVETVGLIAYAPVHAGKTAAAVGKPDSMQHFKRVKVRCRR